MSDLDVRQLRYFVAVAEELHFGRAAQRLSMAQPPLSRAVRDMERLLGVQLLERTTRRVQLTPAGEVLLREARTALEAVGAASRRARRAGESSAVVRLALKADFEGGLLQPIVAAYLESPQAVPVELVLGSRWEQAPAVREGRADVALIVEPYDRHGLDAEHLLTEPRLVALAAADPLAARHRLRLSDLTGRLLPDGSAAELDGPPPHERRPPAQADDGAADGGGPRPRLDTTGILSMVELGSIVWFTPASVARRHVRPEIVYREVVDLEPISFSVAWPQQSRSAAVAALVRAATAVAHAAATDQPVLQAVPMHTVPSPAARADAASA